ncbi:unnamed protein product [Rotaria sp. Silwood2]|nr:unnamed protein product [Rotaria sp. Silwood2]
MANATGSWRVFDEITYKKTETSTIADYSSQFRDPTSTTSATIKPYVAMAPCGGPIAFVYKKLGIGPNDVKYTIIIQNLPKHNVKLKEFDRGILILVDWTINEDLLLVTEDGKYHIIDIFHYNASNDKSITLSESVSTITSACTFKTNSGTGLVALRKNQEGFVAVKNVYIPIIQTISLASLFVCSLENGVFQVYHATHAREAFKNMPLLPRTNEVIRTVQLLNKIAITLDGSKRELTSWSYQYAASIHSTRLFLDDVTINEFVIASNNLNSEILFVLILTTNHWIEIYSAKSLNDEALYSFHLRSPARVHSTISGSFYVLTCNGIVYSIVQQITSDNGFHFNQQANSQLKISCSMMLSTVLTLNGLESLIVFADNGQSMAICTMERVIYIDVDVSSYTPSSPLSSITSEKTQDLLLLYFNNKTLISCQVKLDETNEKGSIQFIPFDQVDKFCLQNNCLATYNNGKTQLALHDIRLCTCDESIQLDNECQYLCFNESATYVFALIKPRVLFMYRMSDRRQMAKLFVYDFVWSMVTDNEFLVLAMNDRRLLTLMIADPDDPTLQARIQALPSRKVQRLSKSATTRLVDHMEKCNNMSSSDEEKSDLEDEDRKIDHQSKNKKNDQTNIQNFASPTSLFRIVTRLNGRYSLSKMRRDEEIRSQVMTISLDSSETLDLPTMTDDSDDENYDDDNDVQVPDSVIKTDEQKSIDDNLSGIRQKTLEFDQNQIKGIQFANAGDRNLKIVNNHAINSTTCSIT